MPSAPRPDKQTLYAEIPKELGRRLKERAQQDRRSQTAVVIMALEQYLGPAEQPAPEEPPPSKRRKKD